MGFYRNSSHDFLFLADGIISLIANTECYDFFQNLYLFNMLEFFVTGTPSIVFNRFGYL